MFRSITSRVAARAFQAQPIQRTPLFGRARPIFENRVRTLQVDASTRNASPATWRTVAFMLVSGTGLAVTYQMTKEKKQTEVRHLESTGKPLLGGPFDLVDDDGKRKTDKDYLGEYVLLYFGFTYCPDICPTELAKMMAVLETIKKTGSLPSIRPVFITIDPERDTAARLKEYKKNYTPEMHWLTGSVEKIDEAAKAYRCYYSIPTPEERQGDDDYLVDHSIFFYLVNKEGDFLEFFGKNLTAPEVSHKMVGALKKDMARQATAN